MIKPECQNVRLQPSNDGKQASLLVSVVVDGIVCQSVVIASGPIDDVVDLFEGKITMQQLGERWKPKSRRRTG